MRGRVEEKDVTHLAARTSGWTLLLRPQQQPWRRLKPQQGGEVPSPHIAHLPHRCQDNT